MSNDTSFDTCALTTFDNPYDPFKQFTEWYLFDVEKGYDTCSHMARLANLTDDMTQKEINDENERVIDKLIEYDFMNIYKKIWRNKPEDKDNTYIGE